jgi:hypothetical protein
MLVSARCDIDKMVVLVEFHQGSKPVKCVWAYAMCGLYRYLQLVIIHVEHEILLPLIVHVIGVPQCIELRDHGFKWLDVREGRSFRHIPCDKSDQDKKLAEVKFVSLILCFPAI